MITDWLDPISYTLGQAAGGGGGGEEKQIATGTFTPASATGVITLPHDLGVVPDMIIAFNTTNTTDVSGIKVIEYYKPFIDTLTNWTQTGLEENTGAISIRRVQNGVTTSEHYGDFRMMDTTSAQYVENVTATTVYFTTSGTAYNWEAGATYRWYAFKFPAS